MTVVLEMVLWTLQQTTVSIFFHGWIAPYRGASEGILWMSEAQLYLASHVVQILLFLQYTSNSPTANKWNPFCQKALTTFTAPFVHNTQKKVTYDGRDLATKEFYKSSQVLFVTWTMHISSWFCVQVCKGSGTAQQQFREKIYQNILTDFQPKT